MGRIIIFDTGYQTVTAVQDLLEVKMASTQAGLLHRAKIMQSSEEAASEAEELQVNIKRGSSTYVSGSGGGTATEVKASTGSGAAGVTSKLRNNTVQASGGTIETLEPGAFNVLAGEWEFTPTPELRFPLAPSEGIILALDEAPADAITMRAILAIEFLVG